MNKNRPAARSTQKVERFAQRSGLAHTTTAQMDLMRTPLGKHLIVYVNNPGLPNIVETIKGTAIGKGINALPAGLIEEGSLKTTNDKTIKYKAGEAILVRSFDGGMVKGNVMGATPAGELIIKETSPSGMHQLKQGAYRIVNPSEVSSIAMVHKSTPVKEALNNIEKFRQIGGRFYEIRPNEVSTLIRIRELLGRPPALNSTGTLPNQGPINPARPPGIR